MLNVDRFVDRMAAARERRRAPPDLRPVGTLRPGVLFDAVFRGWSGYAKAARQIAWRLAPSIHVEMRDAIAPDWCECPERDRFNALRFTRVASDVPYLRLFGPDVFEREPRRMICWTMMETEVVHSDMIGYLERNFDELWTPTRWGEDAFRRSGLTIPSRVMPLGVDPLLYRPASGQTLPPCELYSTDRAGQKEVPQGFLFLSVGLPSLRKGFDVLIRAFEEAFGGDDTVALVVATTHSGPNGSTIQHDTTLKSRVYVLEGSFDEHGMARVYAACNAYVSASRGEGWNLPACEAAATGLPLILPRHTSHMDVFGDTAFYFEPEGVGLLPGADSVSKWYVGMPFPVLGDRSRAELVNLLRVVRCGGDRVMHMAVQSRTLMLNERTWDIAAGEVGRRLLELQP